MRKFYKNLILCGEVDYHCLLCEESMSNDADVEKHVRWEQHQTLLKDVKYLPKYKTDCIIKVGDQFYCEICNILLTTTIKITLHIQNQCHTTNKQTPTSDVPNKSDKIVREGKNIKILNSFIVSENDWNGIIDKQCLLCDMDLEDVASHLKRPNHTLKKIQSQMVFLDGDKFYRKIGEDIFYCFICKSPHCTSNLDTHFSTQEHINNKKKTTGAINSGASTSKQSFNEEFKQNMKKMFKFSEKNNNSTVTNENTGTDILSKQKDFQKEGIDINFERSSAICRKCKFSPAFTVKAITEHIKMHKKAEKDSPGFRIPDDSDEEWITDSDNTFGGDTIYSSSDDSSSDEDTEENKENIQENVYVRHLDFGKIRSELAKFGKEHHIKLINAGSKGHCTLCDNYISAHIKNFRQHVKGLKHINNVQAKSGQPNLPKKSEYTTKPLKSYLKNIFFVKAMDDFWINRKLSIDKHSFALLCHLENNGKYDKIKCFLCDKTFPRDQDQKHCETPAHRNKLFETKVVTSIKREFIREVRPNLFHCGYCNEAIQSYHTLRQHLKTSSHHTWREQQEMIAGNTDDMYGFYMEDTRTAETDILFMQMTGNRLL